MNFAALKQGKVSSGHGQMEPAERVNSFQNVSMARWVIYGQLEQEKRVDLMRYRI